MRERIVAATPLISMFMFLFSGFVLDSWVMGMTFFLLIPLSWILLSRNFKRRINQMMPLIALLVFLWLHFGFDMAHPGWVVFFAIPISDMVLNGKLDAKKLVTLSITIGYIVLGLTLDDFWHPGWLMFLLIPIINTLFFPGQSIKIYTQGSKTFRSSFFEFVDKDDTIIDDDERF